ncbi:MAG: BPTI/Kunitz domain-containing protein [Bacteroidota bacterium]
MKYLPFQTLGKQSQPNQTATPAAIYPSQKTATDFAINRCSLAPNPGLCLAYFPKYFYDQNEGKCKQFIWGGCGGTVPFDTLHECETHCGCGCRSKR